MPFGTDKDGELVWQRAGGIARDLQRKKTAELLQAFADGTFADFAEMLEKQRQGMELTEPQREFMDRFERLFPYAAAKKTENKTDITSNGQVVTGFQIIDASNPLTPSNNDNTVNGASPKIERAQKED